MDHDTASNLANRWLRQVRDLDNDADRAEIERRFSTTTATLESVLPGCDEWAVIPADLDGLDRLPDGARWLDHELLVLHDSSLFRAAGSEGERFTVTVVRVPVAELKKVQMFETRENDHGADRRVRGWLFGAYVGPRINVKADRIMNPPQPLEPEERLAEALARSCGWPLPEEADES
jgi:hypothetical protein